MLIDRMARHVWDALIKPGGKGRTLMVFEHAPEREWCTKIARAITDEVLEEAAQIVDHCNREGPYNAIGAAKRIRALKSQ